MRFIETKTHGIIDYLVGVLILILPAVAGWDFRQAESIVLMVFGIMTIIMSLMTAYEYSMEKIIPVSTHLMIDVLGGIIVAISPWLFEFADRVYLPHLIVGLFSIAAGLLTKTISQPSLNPKI